MSETTKFSTEELEQLSNLRKAYEAKVLEFGQLELEVFLTEQHVEQLKEAKLALRQDYTNLQTQERTLLQELNTKYGSGTVDVATGEFIPNPAQ
jgi:DNA repair exonuclease SbcCD ATPase subunit